MQFTSTASCVSYGKPTTCRASSSARDNSACPYSNVGLASCHCLGLCITGTTERRRQGAKPWSPEVARAPKSGGAVSSAQLQLLSLRQSLKLRTTHSCAAARGSDRISIGGAFRLRTPPTHTRIKMPTLARSLKWTGIALKDTPK